MKCNEVLLENMMNWLQDAAKSTVLFSTRVNESLMQMTFHSAAKAAGGFPPPHKLLKGRTGGGLMIHSVSL